MWNITLILIAFNVKCFGECLRINATRKHKQKATANVKINTEKLKQVDNF